MNKVIATINHKDAYMDQLLVVDYNSNDWLEVSLGNTVMPIKKTDCLQSILSSAMAAFEFGEYAAVGYSIKAV